jgi:LAO/AO transport system kinase
VTTSKPKTDSSTRIQALVQGVENKDVRAAAKLMRLLDDRAPGAQDALKVLYPRTGNAQVIGITGNPGSGKSTLVDQLIAHYRQLDKRVGVVAVDPSSPFSGGAILGDRIRMMDHAADPNVFIRSMATRGQLGGLSRATDDVVAVLDAMGFDLILVETVGVGQDEIDIIRTAQTSVVVMVPGQGDDIQAIKAGILEIADVFVVNKADRDGVDRAVKDLKYMQSLAPTEPEWRPPIVRTIATQGDGLAELIETIDNHQAHLQGSDKLREKSRSREAHLLRNALRDQLGERIDGLLETDGLGDTLVEALVNRQLDPYTAASQAIEKLFSESE